MSHRHHGHPTGPANEGRDASQAQTFPFEAMHLAVGCCMQAQPPAQISTERFYVRLIGYVNDMSLMVTTPVTSQDVRLQLIEGDALVMRVFVNQCAYGFACDVLRVCKLPFNYLHLSFPREVKGTVVRKAPRVKSKIIATVRHPNVGADWPGVISNVSATGALLDARHGMADKGDLLELKFKLVLHNVETHLSVQAAVRNVFTDASIERTSSDLAHFGVEFLNLQPHDQMVLHGMVYQQMIEQPQSMV